MAHTSLFGRLQHLFAIARHGAAQGLSHATEIRASVDTLRRDHAPHGIDRRTFLGASVATAAFAALPLGATGCAPPAGSRAVVVIGAGIAGLHATWRLVEAGVDAVCYEGNTRVGGRMWTARDRFDDDQSCELGGELIDTNHATMWALAEEFGVALDDRFAESPEGFVRDTWWVDGAAVPEDTILEQFVAVAPKMALDESDADTTDEAYARLDAQTLAAWLDENVPSATYPELHAVLDAAYRGEFGLENDEQSALNLLYLIGSDTTDAFLIFGESDERYHAHLGNNTFPDKLAEAIGAERVVFRHKLQAVATDGDGYRVTFSTPDGDVEVVAEHVVFALPFSKLREVDLSAAGLSADKTSIIDELGYGTNAKLMLGFTEQVWRTTHNASGSATTDLPIQQLWDSSVGQSGASGILTVFVGGDQGVALGEGGAAEWATAFLPDVDRVFPGLAAASTGKSVLAQWQKMPWAAGSYTCYRPGQWAFWGTEGAREGNLHFCGEHTSADFQGWMEGGAETGALVAAEIADDYGVALSARHRRIVAQKVIVPQPCYHGSGEPLPLSTYAARKRVLAAAARTR